MGDEWLVDVQKVIAVLLSGGDEALTRLIDSSGCVEMLYIVLLRCPLVVMRMKQREWIPQGSYNISA
jgi:hypothetical protein